MKPSAASFPLESLKHFLREALRETLVLAFDQLESEEDVSLTDFAALLEQATAGEPAEPVQSMSLREPILVATYQTARVKQVGDLSQAELSRFIAAVIREALPALLNDPDWGLELRDNLADFLALDSRGDRLVSLEEMTSRLAVER
ncbi:MAG: hypothetical protein HY784_06035 [Chloroflexi bacterium]|nr:hypothetical protein [Chloroflexota bacterium]